MASDAVLLKELKDAVLGYLEREKMRARLAALAQEKGSIRRREEEARLHEINNVLMVIDGIFIKKEKELAKKQTP